MNLKTAEIIEAFEDFLQARGIRVPTSDAEMEADDALDGNEALIYGSDFAELEEAIERILKRTESRPGSTEIRS